MKRELYTVELTRDEETGRVSAEKWRKADWDYGRWYCPHRPPISVWDDDGRLIAVEYTDEDGNKLKAVRIDPDNGCIIQERTFHKNGEITTYKPQSKKIPFEPEP